MIAPPNRFLPFDLQDKKWSEVTDVTALEAGDWVFDPHPGAHYAGQVLETSDAHKDAGLTDIEWHKSPDNVFIDYVSNYKMLKLIWIDPMEQEV
jgi:hypothetical protein